MQMVRRILISWDIFLALLIAALGYITLNPYISNQSSKDIYSIGINVISILFSLFFAALALIISSGDNNFIKFMEETGDYSELVNNYRITMLILLFTLVYSSIMYVSTINWIEQGYKNQPKWTISLYIFLFLYSIFSSAFSANDAIMFSKNRARFILALHDKSSKE